MLTTRFPRGKRLAAIAAAAFLVAGVAACSSSGSSSPSSSSSSGGTSSSSATLVMESSPETTMVDDFNPFSTTAPIYGMGADGLIYEPLIQFNLAAPPKYYPWLATGYTWSHAGTAHTLATSPSAKCAHS